MSNNIRKILVTVAMIFVVACTAVQAVTTVQFSDNIYGYTEGSNWYDANSNVDFVFGNGYVPVNTRSLPDANEQSAQITGVQVSTTPPGTTDYTLITVDKTSSDRYGQVLINFQQTYWNLTSVCIMSNDAHRQNPQIAGAQGTNTVTELNMHPFGIIQYDDGYGANPTVGGAVGVGAWHTYTMNYDLVAQTWEIWLDDTLQASNIHIDSAYDDVTSIDIAVAWFDYNGNANYPTVVDHMRWITSDSVPFDSNGVMPPPVMPPDDGDPNVYFDEPNLPTAPPSPNSTVLFYDKIAGYEEGVRYVKQNPEELTNPQYGQYAGTTSVVDHRAVTPPKQLVTLSSGNYQEYSVTAVPKSSSARYGQMMVRMAKDGTPYVRMGIFGVSDPIFYTAPYPYANPSSAAELILAADTQINYISSDALVASGVYHSAVEFFNLTINYDLDSQTYDAWYNDTKFADSVAFSASLGTIESIAIGGAWWDSERVAALKYWHWMVSETDPFISSGIKLSPYCGEFGTAYKVGDVDKDCYVNTIDIAEIASQWLNCTDPNKSECDQYWQW